MFCYSLSNKQKVVKVAAKVLIFYDLGWLLSSSVMKHDLYCHSRPLLTISYNTFILINSYPTFVLCYFDFLFIMLFNPRQH